MHAGVAQFVIHKLSHPSIAYLWCANWHALEACISQVWHQFTDWQAKLVLQVGSQMTPEQARGLYPSVLRRPPQSVMIANRSGVNKGSTYIEWKENRLNTRRLPFVTTVWCSHLTHTNGGLRYRAAYHRQVLPLTWRTASEREGE